MRIDHSKAPQPPLPDTPAHEQTLPAEFGHAAFINWLSKTGVVVTRVSGFREEESLRAGFKAAFPDGIQSGRVAVISPLWIHGGPSPRPFWMELRKLEGHGWFEFFHDEGLGVIGKMDEKLPQPVKDLFSMTIEERVIKRAEAFK